MRTLALSLALAAAPTVAAAEVAFERLGNAANASCLIEALDDC